MNHFKILCIVITAFLIISCSSTPVLYPNHHYKEVGKEQADSDIKQCENEADEYLKSPEAKKILKGAAEGSILGAIWGVVWGIFTGNWIGVGIGAAAGAASGAAVGAMSPDQLKQNYVDQCLANEGYRVIGWD